MDVSRPILWTLEGEAQIYIDRAKIIAVAVADSPRFGDHALRVYCQGVAFTLVGTTLSAFLYWMETGEELSTEDDADLPPEVA